MSSPEFSRCFPTLGARLSALQATVDAAFEVNRSTPITVNHTLAARISALAASSIRSPAATTNFNQAALPSTPIAAFAKTLADLYELDTDTPDEQAFLKQLTYIFSAGAEIPVCQFLGVTLDLKISHAPLDELDVKAANSQEKLDQELTATLLAWCDQAKITDARRTFISSKKYLAKLRDGDVSLIDIHVLRRLCQSLPAGFNAIAFIQQFTDASHGSAGQCGAQESLQMHRTLLRASTGYFHQAQPDEEALTTHDLIAETKLAVWNYCERLINHFMQAAGQFSENRRNFEIHLQELCLLGQVTIGQYTAQINPINMTHEVVIRLNQLMDRERSKTRAILTAMKIPMQDVLLTDEHDSIGKVFCEKGAINHISFLQPTIRSILQWLSICGVFQLDTSGRNAEKNYAHLADLFYQFNALEAAEQKICYKALSAIPLFHPSPLFRALSSGNKRLLETLVRIAGDAVYQPIERKTLLQHILDSGNQEMFDCLNRVIEDKNYLAAELHQLFEQSASAERNRKILMFSEASWLKGEKHKNLMARIAILQKFMRTGYVQQKRSPYEINRVLIAALIENDQPQVALLLEEIELENMAFDVNQMVVEATNAGDRAATLRILAFMQQHISITTDLISRIIYHSEDKNLFIAQRLINFSYKNNISLNVDILSQHATSNIVSLLVNIGFSYPKLEKIQSLIDFMKKNKIPFDVGVLSPAYLIAIVRLLVDCYRPKEASSVIALAKKSDTPLDVDKLSQAYLKEIVRLLIGASDLEEAKIVIALAKKSDIPLDAEALSQAYMQVIIRLLAPNWYLNLTEVKSAREVAKENNIQLDLPQTYIQTTAHLLTEHFYCLKKAQSAIEFAKKNNIPLDTEKLSQAYMQTIVRLLAEAFYSPRMATENLRVAKSTIESAKENDILLDSTVLSQLFSRWLIRYYGRLNHQPTSLEIEQRIRECVLFSQKNSIPLSSKLTENFLLRKKPGDELPHPDMKNLRILISILSPAEIKAQLIGAGEALIQAINSCGNAKKSAELKKLAKQFEISLEEVQPFHALLESEVLY